MKTVISSKRVNRSLLGLLAIGLSAAHAAAQTNWSLNGTTLENPGDWNLSGNWSNNLPDPTQRPTFVNGSLTDAPIYVNVTASPVINALLFQTTGLRSVTIGGAALNFQRDNTGTSPVLSTSGNTANVVFNNDINLSNTTANVATQLQLNAANAASLITFNGNFTSSGTGGRTIQILGAGTYIFNGSSSSSSMLFGGTGEVIIGHSSALGSGSVQKNNSSTVSLRSDLELGSGGAGYAWQQYSARSKIRISEVSSSNIDRKFILHSRITGTGTLEFAENINSTGRFIVELGYSGGIDQTTHFETLDSSVIRFTQTGSTSYSSIISGAGELQVTGGGAVTLNQVHTYTGKTLITSGTLALQGSGSLAETSEIQLASTGILDTSGTANASYTLEADQRLSGSGTVQTAGKDLFVNGTLDPAGTDEALTFALGSGVLTLGDSIVLDFDLGAAGEKILLASGTLNIGNDTLDLNSFSFNVLSGFTGGQYELFSTSNTIMGSLGPVNTGIIGGLNASLAIRGTSLYLDVQPIPEPGTWGLAGSGLALLGLRFRRRIAGV